MKIYVKNGETYNYLTIIDDGLNDPNLNSKRHQWVKCRCNLCNREVIQSGRKIAKSKIKSCGCLKNLAQNYVKIGERYGKLTVIEAGLVNMRQQYGKGKGRYCLCKCDCGNSRIIKASNLIKGTTRSCGCLHNVSKKFVEENKEYNYLTVIKELYERRHGNQYCQCRCRCGNIVVVQAGDVLKGKVKSCGCYSVLVSFQRNKGKRQSNYLGKYVGIINNLFSGYKCNANARKLKFDLDKDTFKSLIQSNCYYCNAQPNNIAKSRDLIEEETLYYNGIDRKDNSLGYTKENCVPCCKQCNRAKSALSLNEFYNLIFNINNKYHANACNIQDYII